VAHRREHKCDVCSKRFATAGGLNKHKEIHIGAICSVCGVHLKSKNHLRRHVRTVHEGKKEETCHICGLGFTYKQGLYKHQAEEHNYKGNDLCFSGLDYEVEAMNAVRITRIPF
jgi:uncharacterized Zn-finger protein